MFLRGGTGWNELVVAVYGPNNKTGVARIGGKYMKGKILKMGEVVISEINGFTIDGMSGEELKEWVFKKLKKMPFSVRGPK